jgi:hypothetical protein
MSGGGGSGLWERRRGWSGGKVRMWGGEQRGRGGEVGVGGGEVGMWGSAQKGKRWEWGRGVGRQAWGEDEGTKNITSFVN